MVNLDPGNLSFSKDSVGLGEDEVDSVDVYDVRNALNIRLEDVQRRKKLGPNGAMVDCVESLAKDLPKLLSDLVSISRSKPPQHHFVFDVCGQVELYTHYDYLTKIVDGISHHRGPLASRCTAINATGIEAVGDVGRFIGGVLANTMAMIRVACPTVNVMTKIDLWGVLPPAPFPLSFYLDCQGLEEIERYMVMEGDRFYERNRFVHFFFFASCFASRLTITATESHKLLRHVSLSTARSGSSRLPSFR